MVHLNRIYTRSGDAGLTGLGNGERVSKTHPRVGSYGTVDELNSVLGLAIALGLPAEIAGVLQYIQNDLFDLGADLCVPARPDEQPDSALRISEGQIDQLERWIDQWNANLPALASFILPGGTPAAAQLHVARTVCRRAEIVVWQLHEADSQANVDLAAKYLNRLSDLLFVLARVCNGGGQLDPLWVPGKNRKAAQQSA